MKLKQKSVYPRKSKKKYHRINAERGLSVNISASVLIYAESSSSRVFFFNDKLDELCAVRAKSPNTEEKLLHSLTILPKNYTAEA